MITNIEIDDYDQENLVSFLNKVIKLAENFNYKVEQHEINGCLNFTKKLSDTQLQIPIIEVG
ncbi:MAG: hypothetical protein K2X95_09255 [Flavobacteriaceae bacterium]|nr:hypothetical protein [Flavobacteriaceae bacterium]